MFTLGPTEKEQWQNKSFHLTCLRTDVGPNMPVSKLRNQHWYTELCFVVSLFESYLLSSPWCFGGSTASHRKQWMVLVM